MLQVQVWGVQIGQNALTDGFLQLALEQLPDHIDPAKFNIVLAWIEYGNRLFGALVGLSIAITLYLGLKHCSHLPRIKWPLIAAFFLPFLKDG